LPGKHGATIQSAPEILCRRFVYEPQIEGYQKDKPVAVARFEFGDEPGQRERRVLRHVLGIKTCDVVGFSDETERKMRVNPHWGGL
jgi:hypothetical protein